MAATNRSGPPHSPQSLCRLLVSCYCYFLVSCCVFTLTIIVFSTITYYPVHSCWDLASSTKYPHRRNRGLNVPPISHPQSRCRFFSFAPRTAVIPTLQHPIRFSVLCLSWPKTSRRRPRLRTSMPASRLPPAATITTPGLLLKRPHFGNGWWLIRSVRYTDLPALGRALEKGRKKKKKKPDGKLTAFCPQGFH